MESDAETMVPQNMAAAMKLAKVKNPFFIFDILVLILLVVMILLKNHFRLYISIIRIFIFKILESILRVLVNFLLPVPVHSE